VSQSDNGSPEVLKITLDDLAAVRTTQPEVQRSAAEQTSGPRVYGMVTSSPEAPVLAEQKGSLWLKGWFYLGGAGMLGSVLGWAIAEPAFIDGGLHRWGNTWLVPLVVTLTCVAFALSESAVERSSKKALIRAGIAIPLWVALAFVFYFIANIVYAIAISIAVQMGVTSHHNPAIWVSRGFAWMVFGVAGGIVYGLADRSPKKIGYGGLGGALGAALGGMIFDPISFLTQGGGLSRAVGFGLLGLATGVAMGLVESALKDRWLYVIQGPLAGKQFILYKPLTHLGSDQKSDIYLFKDSQILPLHATLQMQGGRLFLCPQGEVYVSGQPVRKMLALESGSVIQVGRYSFRYQERQR